MTGIVSGKVGALPMCLWCGWIMTIHSGRQWWCPWCGATTDGRGHWWRGAW